MTEEEIQKTITDILVTDFECDRSKLTPDVNLFTDLDLDSIDAVDLVVRLIARLRHLVRLVAVAGTKAAVSAFCRTDFGRHHA